jgi:hypothetical protein
MTVTNWSAFGNQPTNDGVEVVSDSASDTGLCTIWGTDNSTGAIAYETIRLTGTSAVSTTKVTWGNVYGIFLGEADGKRITRAVGTITIRKATGNATIITVTAGNFQKGMAIFLCEGETVEFSSASGTLYWNTLVAATSTNSITESGVVDVSVLVDKYLYFISDNTGAVVQLTVLEG